MKQSELEEKVREIFERQGFEVEKDGNSFTAEKDQSLELKVFSSANFSFEDVSSSVKDGEKVFVDEGLDEVEEQVENDVSVLVQENEEPDHETPSHEIIGDIAVINDLADVERDEAVKGILHYNPNVKTILLKKEGGLKGEFRVGDYEKLHGDETETIHKEHGCRYKVDVTKAFFSEREGTERERILNSVEDGERILVMFCGIGPYPVLLAKERDVEVVGVEKNPEAAKYARENVKLNNLEGSIDIIEGDVAEEIPKLGKFDRILMPSPTNAYEFLNESFQASSEGTDITFYAI